jgi:hypothetical protein
LLTRYCQRTLKIAFRFRRIGVVREQCDFAAGAGFQLSLDECATLGTMGTCRDSLLSLAARSRLSGVPVLVHAHDGGIDHLHRRVMTGML